MLSVYMEARLVLDAVYRCAKCVGYIRVYCGTPNF